MTNDIKLVATSRKHAMDWARVMLNGRNNLTMRQQQMFTHLILKCLGAAGCHAGQEMFGWTTSGDLEQDCEELAQVLFSQTV